MNRLPILSVFIDTSVLREYVGLPAVREIVLRLCSLCPIGRGLPEKSEAGRYLVS